MSKTGFEWMLNKGEKFGFSYTKKGYSIEEYEQMGIGLKEQLFELFGELTHRENLSFKEILAAIGLIGISLIIIPINIYGAVASLVFGMAGAFCAMLFIVDTLISLKLKERCYQIKKIMYLRSVRMR